MAAQGHGRSLNNPGEMIKRYRQNQSEDAFLSVVMASTVARAKNLIGSQKTAAGRRKCCLRIP